MRNLPAAEEIKQLKTALHTHSHPRALLVTRLESQGKNTGLLMLILPREFDIISNADDRKKEESCFAKDIACIHEGWKCAQLNMHNTA